MSAVSFVVRPILHCMRCGYIVETIADPTNHQLRRVTCLNAQCQQYNKSATIADPFVVLLTEKHDGVVLTQETQ